MAVKLLEAYPGLEVFARKAYWSSDFLINLKRAQRKPSKKLARQQFNATTLFEGLKSIGVARGDLVIIHSSYGELRTHIGDTLEPEGIIEGLLDLVGEEGTLAFPTHPAYPNEEISKDTMRDKEFEGVTEYDVRKTRTWTGVIANKFLQREGVVRSRHPINSMAAIGPLAEPMMAKNVCGERPTACGEHSSWKYCSDKNAWIIGLGIDLVHSLTMIHVAEDNNQLHFPPEKWYRERVFFVVDGEFKKNITVLERKPKWATHYAERRFRRDLVEAGVLMTTSICDFYIEYIRDSKKLVEFLDSKNHTQYPYHGVKL